ncbi:IpaD/SipD/SspD family type III secretion system needle tip protein [Paludibacterium paludis]|uniref:Translocator protein BipD n=1 Tax=Paludibacterium paludis TaxID=1225769 RepID=A0A918UBC4_9NEIS|nr:IpaD/SipD/SspD family type III secretion system needle tip protein [Paludibacterium paludis]GGY23925.1 hypothetical protein GCM10011289_29550 [Paludibacterium paludis]
MKIRPSGEAHVSPLAGAANSAPVGQTDETRHETVSNDTLSRSVAARSGLGSVMANAKVSLDGVADKLSALLKACRRTGKIGGSPVAGPAPFAGRPASPSLRIQSSTKAAKQSVSQLCLSLQQLKSHLDGHKAGRGASFVSFASMPLSDVQQSMMATFGTPLTDNKMVDGSQFQAFQSSFDATMQSCWTMMEQLGKIGVLSSEQIEDMLSKSLSEVNTDYLMRWSDLADNYADFYNDLCTDVQEAETGCIDSSAPSDSNHNKFDAKTFNDKIVEIQKKYWNTSGPGGMPDPNSPPTFKMLSGLTKDQADAFAKSTELKVYPDSDGTYYLGLDTMPLADIQGVMTKTFGNPLTDGKEVDSAQFQSFQTSFSSSMQTYQNKMQQLAQLFSQANSTFDNLNKVLSSSIQSLLQTDQGFLKI